MKRVARRSLWAVLPCLVAGSAFATQIESHFEQIAGPLWTIDFKVTNDGVVPLIGEFTVFLDETLYADLSVVSTPPTWDSIAIQPDLGIPAPGYFDSIVLDSANALAVGQFQSAFVVGVKLLSNDLPTALYFEIVDANFAVVDSGHTIVTVTPAVPEPTIAALLALGLGSIGALRRKVT